MLTGPPFAGSGERRAAIGIGALCTALLTVSVLRHEMWRDEFQAWAIARSAGNPLELLDHVAWERHPPLWYLVLWIAARFTEGVWLLGAVGWALGLATMLLVAVRAPWPWWARLAVVTGYYPLYELGTISRSWTLVGLLVVLALVEMDRDEVRPRRLGVILVALAMTEIHALPLACSLAATVVLPSLRSRWSRVTAAVSVVAVAVVLYLVVPAPDGRDLRALHLFPDGVFLRRLDGALGGLARALFPVPEFRVAFRDAFLVDRSDLLVGGVGLVGLAAVTVVAARDRRILVQWLLAFGGLAYLIGALGLPMTGRHSSVLWWSSVAVFWRAARSAPAAVDPSPARSAVRSATSGVVLVALAAGVTGGAWAWATEIGEPFSASAAAVGFVEERVGSSDVVVLCPTWSQYCASVAVPLGTTMHRSADDPGQDFFPNDRRRQSVLDPDLVVDEARRLAVELGVDVAVVEPDIVPSSVPCADRWRPARRSITGEELTVCMLDDLLPAAGDEP